MALPRIDQPLFNLTIPSSKKEIKVRPFLVKDEKILLMALESEDTKQILTSIQQVVQNCIQEDIDVSLLPTFDLEYLFVRLRNLSVGNILKLQFKEEDETINYELNLEDINVSFDEKHTKIIPIDDIYKIEMKYPTFNILAAAGVTELTTEKSFSFIGECIDKLFTDDEVWVLSDSTEKEKETFLEGLSVEAFKKINEFFDTSPKLIHTISYKTKNGTKERTLQGLTDFFTFA